jgi:type IV pilus assembly protein PilB
MLRIDQAMKMQQKVQASEKGTFVDELVSSGTMSPPKLARFLSETFGMPTMDLLALDVSALPVDLIDRKLMAETHIVPLLKRGNRLSVLLSDPTDQAAVDRVKFQQQASIDPIVVEHDKLRKLLERLGKNANDKGSETTGDGLDIEITSDEAVARPRTPRRWTMRRSSSSCRRC